MKGHISYFKHAPEKWDLCINYQFQLSFNSNKFSVYSWFIVNLNDHITLNESQQSEDYT